MPAKFSNWNRSFPSTLSKRFLADENLPNSVVRALRAAGHDVLWVRESHPGSSDHEVVRIASRELRILLTLDKDFGELAFKRHRRKIPGIILFRFRDTSPDKMAHWCLDALDSPVEWGGNFSIVEHSRIRIRPLHTSERSP